MKRWLLTCLLAAPLCSAQDGAFAAKLERMRVEWADDLRAKKMDDIVNLYATDGVFLDPTGTRIAGKPAIRDLMQHVMATFNSDLTFRSLSVEVSGKLAYDSGDYQETLVSRPDGKSQLLKGTYLTIMRRDDDGSWRIVEQMWSQGK